MPIVLERKTEEAGELIARELELARVRLQPISRRRLINLVSKQLELTAHQAEEIVEAYCEAKAPATPEFLGREIFLPYVKIMALLFSILGVVAVGFGSARWHDHDLSWPFFVAGAVAILLGGSGLMKALRSEKENEEEEKIYSSVK